MERNAEFSFNVVEDGLRAERRGFPGQGLWSSSCFQLYAVTMLQLNLDFNSCASEKQKQVGKLKTKTGTWFLLLPCQTCPMSSWLLNSSTITVQSLQSLQIHLPFFTPSSYHFSELRNSCLIHWLKILQSKIPCYRSGQTILLRHLLPTKKFWTS